MYSLNILMAAGHVGLTIYISAPSRVQEEERGKETRRAGLGLVILITKGSAFGAVAASTVARIPSASKEYHTSCCCKSTVLYCTYTRLWLHKGF